MINSRNHVLLAVWAMNLHWCVTENDLVQYNGFEWEGLSLQSGIAASVAAAVGTGMEEVVLHLAQEEGLLAAEVLRELMQTAFGDHSEVL